MVVVLTGSGIIHSYSLSCHDVCILWKLWLALGVCTRRARLLLVSLSILMVGLMMGLLLGLSYLFLITRVIVDVV